MKHAYKGILVLAFSATALIVHAQPAIEWGSRYNSPPDMADEARDIAVDALGNVYVTGSGFNNSGNLDAITIKYDAGGNQLWIRNFDRGMGNNDFAEAIALDAAGNVYITGTSTGATSSGDVLTAKYDNAGTLQWAMFYNDPYNNMDEGRAIAVDANGNVFVCGYSSDSTYVFDALTLCYNASGTLLWDAVYNGVPYGSNELLGLVIDASSNVYVTGNSETQPMNFDVLTIKYNSAGVQQWVRTYDNPTGGGDFGKAITLDPSGNVLVGAQSGVSGNWFDYLVLKYSNSGSLQWNAGYNNGPNRYEDLWAICTDNAGYVYITGQSQSTGGNSAPTDIATLKYTPAGAQVWVQRYDGGFNSDDRAYAMVLDDTANVYVAGFSKNASNTDYITVKYDSAGTQKFALRYNSQYNASDEVNAIAVKNGNIYITGRSANAANEDFLTIKYSYAATGVAENAAGLGALSAYPVPAGDLIQLNLPPATDPSSELIIHDLSGKVVVRATAASVLNSRQLDLSGLAAGTYTLSHFAADGRLLSSQRIVKN